MKTIYPIESIINIHKPTDNFLVQLEDNTYGIRFKGFKLRDCDTGEIFHEFKAENIFELDYFADHLLEYKFSNKILKSKTLGSSITLVVGNQLVQKLSLIERHYIDDELVANYRNDYPVFLPNSENNIEFIYSIPTLNEVVQKKLLQGEVVNAKSDTFIFVDNNLVIHRRAVYQYMP